MVSGNTEIFDVASSLDRTFAVLTALLSVVSTLFVSAVASTPAQGRGAAPTPAASHA